MRATGSRSRPAFCYERPPVRAKTAGEMVTRRAVDVSTGVVTVDVSTGVAVAR